VDPSKLPVEQRAIFYRLRGDAYLKTDNTSAALKDYKALTQADSKNSDYHYKYGAIALKADQLDTAIRALDQAVRLDSGNTDKAKTYASALIQKGRQPGDKVAKKSNYLKASELASKVVAKDGSFENLMLLLSAQLGAGLYGDAARTGERAMAKNPKDWIVPFYIGQAYTSDGKFAQAVDPLKKSLELADANNQKKVWRQLGFAYEKMRQLEESIAAYQKAGDNTALTRVRENLETAQYNEQVEADNAQIRAMEEEAKRLEEELKKLEEGGGV
jgi:tetratricopeptide (TPR) repeat protein